MIFSGELRNSLLQPSAAQRRKRRRKKKKKPQKGPKPYTRKWCRLKPNRKKMKRCKKFFTPKKDPFIPPRPPDGARIRRSVFTLNENEWTIIHRAYNQMRLDGVYYQLAYQHIPDMPYGHRGVQFLGYHRRYMEEFERVFLQYAPELGAHPYWPWWLGQGNLFLPSTLGPNGNPNNNGRVQTGPFADWEVVRMNNQTGAWEPDPIRGVIRRHGQAVGSLPTRADITALFKIPVYATAPFDTRSNGFCNHLEGWPGGPKNHNRVHVWEGGTSNGADSTFEPSFWFKHMGVDMLWWLWQQIHGIYNFQGPGGIEAPIHRYGDSFRSVCNIHERGYGYAPA